MTGETKILAPCEAEPACGKQGMHSSQEVRLI